MNQTFDTKKSNVNAKNPEFKRSHPKDSSYTKNAHSVSTAKQTKKPEERF